MLLGLLLSCAEPPAAPAPPPPAGSAPGRPGHPPPKNRPGQLYMEVQFVHAEPGLVRVVGPEGDRSYPMLPNAEVRTGLTPGATITLVLDERGPTPGVTALTPHPGLPIAWGEVGELSAEQLVLTGPVGPATYRINRWSDLPEGLAVGEFVAVKSYNGGDHSAILNVRRFPGRGERRGTLTAVQPGQFTVKGLGGPHTYAAATSLPVGTPVLVHHGRNLDGAPMDVRVEQVDEPHRFYGKLSRVDGTRVTMVDAWGGTLGLVDFALRDALPPGAVPGDLLEIDWQMVDGNPTVTAATERPLSPVFFGRIDAISDLEVRLTTLQRQPKLLRLTPETWFPRPIAVGDMADVMWSTDPSSGALLAEAVVKE